MNIRLISAILFMAMPFVGMFAATDNAAPAAQKEVKTSVVRQAPAVAPAGLLDAIVAEHKGKVVVVDLWATWCGPCRMGMTEIEPYKAELAEKGVDFVYITNETSPEETWKKMIPGIPGTHYRVPVAVMENMKIPGFRNSIPHYIIYKADGTLSSTQTGWLGAETLIEAIKKAF
ncbi:MAG: TlpA family protein disulfide reductase [Muribaculaceae bacterium]|nr:TlpA family protein disulfide reductase [Muribaculaceae bacterium]